MYVFECIVGLIERPLTTNSLRQALLLLTLVVIRILKDCEGYEGV